MLYLYIQRHLTDQCRRNRIREGGLVRSKYVLGMVALNFANDFGYSDFISLICIVIVKSV